jgi:Straboviridae intron-associated endonuclease 1
MPRVAKLASQADLCYNKGRNIIVLGGAGNTPSRTHLVRRYVMNTIPSTSGIYKITCTANKRIYIGSATNLRERSRQHFRFLRQNKHHNQHLQRAWNKYGEQSFTFEVLEQVLPISLTAREQYWLNKLKPFDRKGFNIAHEAGSTLGYKYAPEVIEKIRQQNIGRKQSPESIEKRRQHKKTPETLEKYRQNMLGNKHALGHSHKQSPETREKIRQGHLGKKNSPEHIEHMRQANLGKKQSAETIEKRRQTHLGSKRSPETRERMRQANRAAWQRRRSNDYG